MVSDYQSVSPVMCEQWRLQSIKRTRRLHGAVKGSKLLCRVVFNLLMSDVFNRLDQCGQSDDPRAISGPRLLLTTPAKLYMLIS